MEVLGAIGTLGAWSLGEYSGRYRRLSTELSGNEGLRDVIWLQLGFCRTSEPNDAKGLLGQSCIRTELWI